MIAVYLSIFTLLRR